MTTLPATSTIESLTLAEIEIEAAEWMISSGGMVWVLPDAEFGDDREVYALQGIDPETNTVTATFSRVESGCNGPRGRSVWVCDGSVIRRLDPRTGEVQATLEIEMSNRQGPIPTDDQGLWYLEIEGTELLHIGFDGTELGRVDLGIICDQVGLTEQHAFVTCGGDSILKVVDLAQLEVVGENDSLQQLGVVTGAGDRVWLGFAHGSGGVGWIDAALDSGEVDGSPEVSLGCLAVEGDRVWARGTDLHLVRIDAATATVTETFASERNLGAGCVTVADGSVWVSSVPFGTVRRLDLG